ncbi:YggT family protein [Phormidium yuhuli AB48]|uniref:YggT family protein n=1 Tax=Phormidium yuhuli AB48 TaxID=2940671 RepID=A0ABY5AL00_9CYAN|nr:YggT family protein [Phormidium yuhuli]USR89880.1 YggT family protein [Phormidium yuhuli AB48]
MNPNPDPRNNLSPEERDRLHSEEERVLISQRALIVYRVIRIISYLVSALLVLLFLRFLLRFSGANPENMFASFIYNLSEPFFAPFDNLFMNPTDLAGTNVLDVNILVAMGAYALLGWLAIRLIYSFFAPQ